MCRLCLCAWASLHVSNSPCAMPVWLCMHSNSAGMSPGQRGVPGPPSPSGSLLTLHLCQPFWLEVVLRGNGEGVQCHQQDDKPVEELGLHHIPALPTKHSVPTPPPTAGEMAKGSAQGCAYRLQSKATPALFSRGLPWKSLRNITLPLTLGCIHSGFAVHSNTSWLFSGLQSPLVGCYRPSS